MGEERDYTAEEHTRWETSVALCGKCRADTEKKVVFVRACEHQDLPTGGEKGMSDYFRQLAHTVPVTYRNGLISSASCFHLGVHWGGVYRFTPFCNVSLCESGVALGLGLSLSVSFCLSIAYPSIHPF